MEICLTSADTNKQLAQIKKLYKESFPRNERKPFFLILKKRKQGYADIISIKAADKSAEDERILGEAIIVKNGDIALLDYFAISPDFRGRGIGSQALKLLQKRYGNCRFILEIESTFHPAPDAEQRTNRKNFYLRGGMGCMDYLISLFGVEMEIMTYGCEVAFEEYYAFYETTFGRYMKGHVVKIK